MQHLIALMRRKFNMFFTHDSSELVIPGWFATNKAGAARLIELGFTPADPRHPGGWDTVVIPRAQAEGWVCIEEGTPESVGVYHYMP